MLLKAQALRRPFAVRRRPCIRQFLDYSLTRHVVAMPISGLVITLAECELRRSAALAALRDHGSISLGPQTGLRLPAVVETAHDDEDRSIWEWLRSLPGVEQVDVAMIHFEESQEAH